MDLLALALVLVAAGAHAVWNLLAKGAVGGVVFVWLSTAAAVLLWAPAAAVQLALRGGAVTAAGVGFMAGSGVLHAAYYTTLQRGYGKGDLSVVYPLARGTGPLLSVTAAVLLLGERPSALGLVGGGLIVAAVLALAIGPRGARTSPGTGLAVATGATIAAYTVWDAHAVAGLHQPAIAYLWGTQATEALLLAAPALRDRSAVAATWRRSRGAVAGVATLSPLAYVLVLVALTRAPVSLVAPVRESSVVLGAVLGTRVLGEGDPRKRFVAAAAIAVGIVALAV